MAVNSMINNGRLSTDFVLVMGERVYHKSFKSGVITDVQYDDKGNQTRFQVKFDNGEEKIFGFPAVFYSGIMELESGEKVDVKVESIMKKEWLPWNDPENNTIRTGKDTYAYWAERYPDHVVIRHEYNFWRCRGESARKVNRYLGYKLGGNPAYPVTGTEYLELMLNGLIHYEISYIVIEDGKIMEQRDY